MSSIVDWSIHSVCNWARGYLFIGVVVCLPSSASSQWFADSTDSEGSPRIYTYSHLLLGTEVIDPVSPSDFFQRTTRLWKTDIRIGMAQSFRGGIVAFFALRDNDSPRTNDVHLYEAGLKVLRNWGYLWFGQRRFQAGADSYYLNESFDRVFWDQGLIYDFRMRGIGLLARMGKSEGELFLGSDIAASFVGGAGYRLRGPSGWNARISGLYVARDPRFSAFGGHLASKRSNITRGFSGTRSPRTKCLTRSHQIYAS